MKPSWNKIYTYPDCYRIVLMDTDSLYLAVSSPNLSELCRPGMRESFEKEYSKWVSVSEETKRIPGMLHKEWVGDEILALCSKTYLGIRHKDGDDDELKIKCKGVSKANKHPDIKSTYEKCLFEKSTEKCVNQGFRPNPTDKHTLSLYSQEKIGWNGLYLKRHTLPCGISTRCLDIAINPEAPKPKIVTLNPNVQPPAKRKKLSTDSDLEYEYLYGNISSNDEYYS